MLKQFRYKKYFRNYIYKSKMNKFKICICFIMYILALLAVIYYKNLCENYMNYEEYELYNGDYWQEYRIGDLYKFGEFIACGGKNPGCQDNRYHMKHFPSSIAYFYHIYNPTDIKLNEEAMKNAITKVKSINNITIYDNVLHLRVGDVMLEKVRTNVQNNYSKNNDDQWWEDYIKWSKDNSLKNVLIIAGSHNIKNRDKWKPSLDFINKIKTLLEKHNIYVDLRIGQSPDVDIITGFTAKYFASTGGGFGNLIKTLSKLNNVNVFDLGD